MLYIAEMADWLNITKSSFIFYTCLYFTNGKNHVFLNSQTQMVLPCATLTFKADEKLISLKTFVKFLPPDWGQLQWLSSKTHRAPPPDPHHSAALSSSSHSTGCAVSKVRIWIWIVLNYFEVIKLFQVVIFMWCFPHKGLFTNVYLTIKRPLSNTETLNRIQNDLKHWPVSHIYYLSYLHLACFDYYCSVYQMSTLSVSQCILFIAMFFTDFSQLFIIIVIDYYVWFDLLYFKIKP